MTNSTSESSTPADPYGDLIRRARELDSKATKGKWHGLYANTDEMITLDIGFPTNNPDMTDDDIEFTCNARQLVPDLTNALEAVLAENAQLKAWLATIARVFNPKPPEEREDEE